MDIIEILKFTECFTKIMVNKLCMRGERNQANQKHENNLKKRYLKKKKKMKQSKIE